MRERLLVLRHVGAVLCAVDGDYGGELEQEARRQHVPECRLGEKAHVHAGGAEHQDRIDQAVVVIRDQHERNGEHFCRAMGGPRQHDLRQQLLLWLPNRNCRDG